MMTREGNMRDMRFTVCDVSQPLGSVSQMCRVGHRVVFNPPWGPERSYIQYIETGECMRLEEHIGLYMLNTKIAPWSKQKGVEKTNRNNAGLGWLANPWSPRGKGK